MDAGEAEEDSQDVFWFSGKGAMTDKLCDQREKDSGCSFGIFYPFLMGSRHKLAVGYCSAWILENTAECKKLKISCERYNYI